MNPPVPSVLAEIAGLLMQEALTAATPNQAQDLGLSAALLGIAAETFDGHVHRLVEENRAVRAVLGETGEDADFHVSALTAENHRLRERLIARHAEAEAADDAKLCDAIWAELVAGADRRRISSAPC
jgi:hypothetical protein